MSPSVVLVHGIRTSSSMWRRQVRFLEARGHRVLAPDLPGHGARMDERFTLEGAIDTISDAVDSLGDDVLLVGFSLGAYLSVHYAGTGDRPIRGLIAASCSTQAYPVILWGYRMVAAGIHRFPDRGQWLNDWAVRTFIRYPGSPDDVLRGGTALEVMDDVLRELRKLDTRASLARIEQPVWLVNGSLDHFRIQERAFARQLKRGTVVRLQGANHMVSLTRPTQFNRLLADAIDQLSPESRTSHTTRRRLASEVRDSSKLETW
ncbi:alpha/beta fold hydrolase [Lysobacter korlensis]|uniref:Alpha/beta fold hydrolase n=1 Tax=Lysobacter korlensis TaxID=553636 RepID=A0ABV6RQN4_9GAMM